MRFDNGLTRWMLAIGALVLGLSVEPASAQCQVTERARLSASDGQVGDQFGTAVSVSGQLALIGSGWPFDRDSAYVFRFDGSSWIEEAKLTAPDAPDRFGQSVSISSDLMSGDVALIGAFFDDDGGTNVGSAYVFRFDGSSWVQEQKLLADDGAPGDRFGISVSISGDLAVIGAYRDDDGGTNAGSAYVFRFDGAQWNQEAKLIASDADLHAEFGFSVSTQEAGGLLPGNEDVAAIGAPGHIGGGTAYVFQVDASKWVQAAKLTSSDLAVFDVFGYSVSISGDVVVIGAWGDDDSGQASGSAYVYEEPPGGWQDMTQTGKLTASDGAANDRFGFSVSNSPDIVVIGARLDDDAGFSSGSAYAFKKPAAGWGDVTEAAKMTASNALAGDEFGFSVSVSGDVGVVGAIFQDQDPPFSNEGAAYVFDVTSATRDPCDTNCDGEVNSFDIEPFLDLLFGMATPCADCSGDVNGDGTVDSFDIEPFLDCLFP